MDAAEAVERLRRVAHEEPDVLGFALTGSRAMGFANEHSDHDCALFVREGRGDDYRRRFAQLPAGVDLRVFTLEEFRRHAAWGSPTAWDRYAWTHARIDPDRTGGELRRLAAEKGRVPEEEVAGYVAGSLDGYLNQVYRSLKCRCAGDAACQRLEAAESVRPLLQALFAVHDRRVVPYYRYLAWELEQRPLSKLSLSGGELLGLLLRVPDAAEPAAQGTLLRAAEALFRAEGYGHVFDAWPVREWWGTLLS